jgi:hypothetical protein
MLQHSGGCSRVQLKAAISSRSGAVCAPTSGRDRARNNDSCGTNERAPGSRHSARTATRNTHARTPHHTYHPTQYPSPAHRTLATLRGTHIQTPALQTHGRTDPRTYGSTDARKQTANTSERACFIAVLPFLLPSSRFIAPTHAPLPIIRSSFYVRCATCTCACACTLRCWLAWQMCNMCTFD